MTTPILANEIIKVPIWTGVLPDEHIETLMARLAGGIPFCNRCLTTDPPETGTWIQVEVVDTGGSDFMDRYCSWRCLSSYAAAVDLVPSDLLFGSAMDDQAKTYQVLRWYKMAEGT
jgi:hypothetical protein